MIDFHLFQQIHHPREHERLTIRQIAARLQLHPETVSRWFKQSRFEPRQTPKRASKLAPFRGDIARSLEQHPDSARQIWQRLRQQGYAGAYIIVGDLVRSLRPAPTKAFLSLHFLPGQCAQLDWGHAGWMQIGFTRRRVSFLVLVFAYSRKMYVEFTLGQSMEQFLCAQQNGFRWIGGVTA